MNKIALQSLIEITKKLKLLFVEDDSSSRDVFVSFLETFFDDIVSAHDGLEAYEKYKNESFDIIITDINMPNMSGLELIAKIREENLNIPILVLSAFNESAYFIESIKHGVDGYLLKPFDVEYFSSSMMKVVSKLENERKLQEYKQNLEKMVHEKTKELEHRWLHEYYTDLPNSIMLQDDLMSQEYDYMLLLDMSHFSVLNKEYGKEFANHVIKRTARILEKHIHKNAKLYKTESDRFAILIKKTSLEHIYEYCNQIISFFDTKNIQVDDSELHITFNIGIDKIRADVADTLINCEYALDKSKELGSRHYEIFDEHTSVFQDEKEAVQWLRLTRELVLNEKIEPYFQPIQDVQTGKITKYEVLARGIYKGEIIPPICFIKPSEKLGLSTAITRLIINKSFEFFQDKTETFSINLTERDLLEGYLVKFLNEKLLQYKIEPSRVIFEILENITVAKNSQRITAKLNKLREMGFEVAVDDFGIENSNFS